MKKSYEIEFVSISCDNLVYKLNILDKENLKLFRYRSFNEFSLSEIVNSEFILSSPNTFNDPYDGSFILNEFPEFKLSADIVVTQIDKPSKRYTTKGPMMITQMGKEFFSKPYEYSLKNSVRIACLTTNINSEVMWSHYANKGKGFALEYSYKQIDDYINEKKLENCFLLPVFYKNIKLRFPLFNSDNVGEMYDKFLNQGLILKNKDWNYENEWRLIYSIIEE